jgi:hypothetical protein
MMKSSILCTGKDKVIERVKEFEFARYILDVFVQLAVSAFYSVAQPNKQPSTRNPNE